MTFHRKLLSMILVHAVLLVYAVTNSFEWYYLILAWLLGKLLNAIGHEIGMHRLWSHRSFKTTRFKELILHIFATPLMYGSTITYVGVHRQHHAFSDTDKDPHITKPWYNMLFYKRNEKYNVDFKFVSDVIKDPYQKFFHRYYFHLNIALLLTFLIVLGPVVTGWVLSFSVVYNWLAACAVNVLGHRPNLGYRNFETKDGSANNRLLQLIFWGVGLHNNHHANPNSWTVKTKPGEVDFPGFLIRHFFKL